MAGKSKDLSILDAKRILDSFDDSRDIILFIEEDPRKGVISFASAKIKELNEKALKQGQTDRITETATATGLDKEFKGSGIEGKKEKDYVTCEDVIKTMRAKGVKI